VRHPGNGQLARRKPPAPRTCAPAEKNAGVWLLSRLIFLPVIRTPGPWRQRACHVPTPVRPRNLRAWCNWPALGPVLHPQRPFLFRRGPAIRLWARRGPHPGSTSSATVLNRQGALRLRQRPAGGTPSLITRRSDHFRERRLSGAGRSCSFSRAAALLLYTPSSRGVPGRDPSIPRPGPPPPLTALPPVFAVQKLGMLRGRAACWAAKPRWAVGRHLPPMTSLCDQPGVPRHPLQNFTTPALPLGILGVPATGWTGAGGAAAGRFFCCRC